MILEDIANYLTSQGIVVPGGSVPEQSPAYGVYYGFLPDMPNRAVALFETGGGPPIHTHSSGPGNAVMEQPRVQVVVRSTSYAAGRQAIQRIYESLDGFRPRLLGGVRYHWAAAVQAPFLLERDANQRPVFACNFSFMKELSTA